MESVAPATQKAYRAAMAKFNKFRLEVGYGSRWPVSEEEVLHFFIHQRRNSVTAHSMRLQLAGIAFYSKAARYGDPCQAFRIRKLLKSWRKHAPRQQDTRCPLSHKTLSQIVQALKRLSFTTAFFGALRLGEVVANSKSDASNRALQLRDITVQDNALALRIRKSKTDQKGKGVSLFIRGLEPGHLCPVRSLSRFLLTRGSTPGLLFTHRDGSPLTRYQFMAVFRGALQHLGLPWTEFGGHSFRIGAATTAAAGGVPVDIIKSMGRWKSSAYASYIRPGLLLEGTRSAGCSFSSTNRTAMVRKEVRNDVRNRHGTTAVKRRHTRTQTEDMVRGKRHA
ncbi:integrase/recombinase xerD homolog [Anolis sagrei]|uniref:integrase/recombinase xerD homolog n=1 Tax=Anolis sagrei TaxID=38937 RepID=UPI003521ABC6